MKRVLAIIALLTGMALAQSGNTVVVGAGGAASPDTIVFSNPVTGVSESATLNAVLGGGPITMTTPSAAGTYKFSMQITQTTPGSGGTCTTGAVTVSLGYKDPDTGVVYTVGTVGMMTFYPLSSTSPSANPLMVAAANGSATNWTAIHREFRAAAGTAIQYQVTQQAASNCTVPPVFSIRPVLYSVSY